MYFHYHTSTRKDVDQSDTNVENVDADDSGGGGDTDGKKEDEEEGVTEEQDDETEVRDDLNETN